MKARNVSLWIVFIGSVALFALCGCKQESSTGNEPAKAVETQPAAQPSAPAVQAVKDAGQAIQTQAVSAAQQLQATATNTVEAAKTEASGQAQSLIDKAKALVGQSNYQGALDVVQQLAQLKLTPEQQTLVSNLKTQIQNALAKKTASDAASALGNALGGKK